VHEANKYTLRRVPIPRLRHRWRGRLAHPSCRRVASKVCLEAAGLTPEATVCTLLALCRPFKEVAWNGLEAHYIAQQAMAAGAVSFISIVDGSHFRAICLDPVSRTLTLIDPAGVDSIKILREVVEAAQALADHAHWDVRPIAVRIPPPLAPHTRAAAAMVHPPPPGVQRERRRLRSVQLRRLDHCAGSAGV